MILFRNLFRKRTIPDQATPEPEPVDDAPAPHPDPALEAGPAEAPERDTTPPAATPPEPRTENIHTISRPEPRAGRLKTRLISYGQLDSILDELEGAPVNTNGSIARPVGWLVIIEGPGTGGWFTLDSGVTRIGRGDDQNVQLNFGDDTISRSNHASIAYEQAEHRFRLGPGDCRNEVLVNGTAIQRPTNLSHGDRITIGETTLRLAAFCDDRFSWAPIIDKGDRNALSA